MSHRVSVWAQARIDGISGTSFSFTTGAGEISTPDGGSINFWGYQDTTGDANPFGVPQYPGPTLILNQGDTVTISLTSGLPVPGVITVAPRWCFPATR